jgi:superfamily II DNA or RNA helicase
MERKPHQIQGVRDVLEARQQGERIIILTAPTGGGKTLMMVDLILSALEDGDLISLYTNRRLLIEQTVKVMTKNGLIYGVRAAGWDQDLKAKVQISSMQTEHSQVMLRNLRDLHAANLVLVDEFHQQKEKTYQAIYQKHLDMGATIVGITATPIDLGEICGIKPKLIVAGKNSELRECKMLVPAVHYGCSEPELREIGRKFIELSEPEISKLIMVYGIFGHVIRNYERLNPKRKPTLLFGPDVAGSLFFAEQFYKEADITAAHIDSKSCWINGKTYPSDKETRERILEGSRSGEIKVITNRFVLREGIDVPWVEHIILATVINSLQSYLQALGRGLRASPSTGKTELTIHDHGGLFWRHGSVNIDRVWDINQTEKMIYEAREKRILAKEEKEPFLCPQCGRVLLSVKCPSCGFVMDIRRKSRPVAQSDGTIKQYFGDIFRPRKTDMRDDTEKKWIQMYWRAKNSKNGMTFKQAESLFNQEHRYWPPRDLPNMPIDSLDWARKVRDVPFNKLIRREPERE